MNCLLGRNVKSLLSLKKKKKKEMVSAVVVIGTLTLKVPRKTASENVCLCRLLNILADFSNLFLLTGKEFGP